MSRGPFQIAPLRVYADTSVYGGCFDSEFGAATRAFFQQVRERRLALFTSAMVEAEIEPAPPHVRALFEEFDPYTTVLDVTDEAMALRQAYLKEAIVSERWMADALHVAIAAAARCPVIVSWNFRHIVHADKIPLYNAVNTLHGVPAVAIHSPPEVLRYGESA